VSSSVPFELCVPKVFSDLKQRHTAEWATDGLNFGRQERVNDDLDAALPVARAIRAVERELY
jgi:hypothetical protein